MQGAILTFRQNTRTWPNVRTRQESMDLRELDRFGPLILQNKQMITLDAGDSFFTYRKIATKCIEKHQMAPTCQKTSEYITHSFLWKYFFTRVTAHWKCHNFIFCSLKAESTLSSHKPYAITSVHNLYRVELIFVIYLVSMPFILYWSKPEHDVIWRQSADNLTIVIEVTI